MVTADNELFEKWLLDPPPYFLGQMAVQQNVGGFRGGRIGKGTYSG
jgi:hypothetical protein